MDYQSFKNAVIARCRELGVTQYELYYQSCKSTTVGVFRQEINQFTGSDDGGVCLRCIVNGRMGYASTQELSEGQAIALVDTAVDNAAVLETDDPVFLGKGGQTYETLNRPEMPVPSTEALISAALSAQQALYDADPAVVDGTTTQALSEGECIAICNSEGLDLRYENRISGIITVAVISNGKEMANHAELRLDALSAIDHRALAQTTVSKALKKLGGDMPPTGSCPVVFSPKAMSDLLSVFSGMFSAERARKGLSKLAGQEGSVIAAPCVTIVDDPFHPDSPMPMPFDAEGSPTRRKNVVEGGTLKTLLYDLKNAALSGVAPTGNASKASYNSPVGISPFSMTVASGAHTPEELLVLAGEGLYVDSVAGLHAGANTVSGDFSVESAGYLIRGGQLTDRVKSCTVAGNFYELLKNISALANDSHLPMPLGSTAFGAPTTLVRELSVAGK